MTRAKARSSPTFSDPARQRTAVLTDKKFMTPKDVSDRYEGRIGVRTLANWRSQGSGPPFVKIGGAILYKFDDLNAWEQANTVSSTSQYGAKGA